MLHYRAQIEATNKGGFVFKLGSASAILGVDFRRFQQNPPKDVPFVIRLHSDAVFASLAARTTEPAGTHFTCFTGTKVQILTQVEEKQVPVVVSLEEKVSVLP